MYDGLFRCVVCLNKFKDAVITKEKTKICINCRDSIRLVEEMYFDSTGRNEIYVGCKVKFRGKIYTVRGFNPGMGPAGTAQIYFEEKQHTEEIASEITVDFVE